jgi:hypothetical protein
MKANNKLNEKSTCFLFLYSLIFMMNLLLIWMGIAVIFKNIPNLLIMLLPIFILTIIHNSYNLELLLGLFAHWPNGL